MAVPVLPPSERGMGLHPQIPAAVLTASGGSLQRVVLTSTPREGAIGVATFPMTWTLHERDRFQKLEVLAHKTDMLLTDTIERMEFLRKSTEEGPLNETLERHDRIVERLQRKQDEWRKVKENLTLASTGSMSRDREVATL